MLACTARVRPAVAPAPAAAAPSPVEQLTHLLEERPEQLFLAYYLALLEGRAGRVQEALGWLERLAAGGWDLGLAASDFAGLAADPRFPPLAARLDAAVRPTAASAVAFRLAERDLVPEGIAHDPVSGDFFLGSIAKRKIVRVAADGAPRDFVPPAAHGLGQVLGLHADTERRRLWAASNGGGEDGATSAVFAFDLDSGALAGRFPLAAGARRTLNDLCLDAAGALYVTESATGGLFTLRPGAAALAELVPAAAASWRSGSIRSAAASSRSARSRRHTRPSASRPRAWSSATRSTTSPTVRWTRWTTRPARRAPRDARGAGRPPPAARRGALSARLYSPALVGTSPEEAP